MRINQMICDNCGYKVKTKIVKGKVQKSCPCCGTYEDQNITKGG